MNQQENKTSLRRYDIVKMVAERLQINIEGANKILNEALATTYICRVVDENNATLIFDSDKVSFRVLATEEEQ